MKGYGIKSKVVRIGERTPRGYASEDFADAWKRYLPPSSDERNKCNKRNNIDNKNNYVADVADVAEGMADGKDNDPFASLKDQSLVPDLPSFLDRRRVAA